MFVTHCKKKPDSWGFLFFLQSRDLDEKEFAEKEMNFHLKNDCGNKKVLMKKFLGKEDTVS